MRAFLKISFLILLLAVSVDGNCRKKQTYLQRYVDTLVSRLRSQAVIYHNLKPDYEANIFVNGDVDFTKRNRLQQFIPYLNKAAKDINHYNAEFIGGVTFTNPNIYNQTLFTISSNKKKFVERHIDAFLAPNLRMDIYSQFIFGSIYSPLAHKSDKYYNYSLDSIWYQNNATYYKISFTPNINNFKFVSGYLIATNRNWSVREIKFKGGMEFLDYTNTVKMGDEGNPDEFLPKKIQIETNTRVLGNHLNGKYVSSLKYNNVKESHLVRDRGRDKYNLTALYNTKVDTLAALANFIVKFRDSVFLAENQTSNVEDLPVSLEDTVVTVRKSNSFVKMGKFVVSNHSIDLKQVGELKITPLVSPVLFDYSTRKGLSYTQKLKYSKITEGDRVYKLEPRLGYNFKYRELYWGVKGEVVYSPKKMSRLFIDIGNGNKINTNMVINTLYSLPFMVFDTSRLNLKDFRNSYAKIGHKIEVSNGFTLATNLAFQTYNEIDKSDLTVIFPQSQYVKRSKEIARHTYRSFVPEIELTYTPHQYYYYEGNRKVYLYSRFPTFTLNYAKAIEGVFNSTMSYNRLEFDMNHQVSVGPMHNLYYRIGAGGFFNYSDLFFAEFNYLRKNNLPSDWDDDIGGAFQLLNRYQYNEIERYMRVNLRYDAPFLLASSLLKKVKYVTKEKLYCNFLYANTMNPYVEIGYGIGTYLFNIGVFWGGEVTKWDKVGVKFTFEIFNN